MRTIKVEGIIIKRRNYGEADKYVTVLTKSQGKLHIKAPGVRKISSRRSPHIELLNCTLLTIYINNTTTLLTEAQMITDYKDIKDDLVKIGYAYHICEITDGLCPENEENEAVYHLLKQTLNALCNSTNAEVLIREFEIKMLELLGFATLEMRRREFFNVHAYIESLLEKKLKSKDIFISQKIS